MKKAFVKTKSVRDFVAAMSRLKNAEAGIPKMSLLSGKYGHGRTRTALWYAGQDPDVKMIRLVSLINGPWLLSTILGELGQFPENRVQARFGQCVNALMDTQYTLIFDEIEYLIRDSKAIEILRDLHDITGTVIVFVGMEDADKKLMRYPHLVDRLTERIKFDNLSLEDIRLIAAETCEVKLSDDAVSFLHSQGVTRFRPLVIMLYRAEAIARANGLKEVTAQNFIEARKK